jgi:curved DNA-binding protein
MSWQPPPPPPRPQGPQPGPQPGAQPTQPLQAHNFYKLLQVDVDAHPTVIRYAYRFLAAQYHPDNAESGDAEKFRLVSEAYRTLSDRGRRQAYDLQAGIQSQQQPQAAAGQAAKPDIPKMSLSFSEVELRLAVLQVLLEARRKRPQTGGASAKMLMDCLNCNMQDIEWTLWYLREKGHITRTEAAFMISVAGVDYLVDVLSRTQPMTSKDAPTTLDHTNLPATL